MKKNVLLVMLATMITLSFPTQMAAYNPWCLDFSCYGPCRPDCCGYGYEYCRRCPNIAPCCGTVVVIAAVVAAILVANEHRHHSHSHSHSHGE